MKKVTTPTIPMLTVAEVAARLGPSENTIYRWCEKGLIRYRKYPSGGVYIPLNEVERIERESERAPVTIAIPESSRIRASRGTNEELGKNQRHLNA